MRWDVGDAGDKWAEALSVFIDNCLEISSITLSSDQTLLENVHTILESVVDVTVNLKGSLMSSYGRKDSTILLQVAKESYDNVLGSQDFIYESYNSPRTFTGTWRISPEGIISKSGDSGI